MNAPGKHIDTRYVYKFYLSHVSRQGVLAIKCHVYMYILKIYNILIYIYSHIPDQMTQGIRIEETE